MGKVKKTNEQKTHKAERDKAIWEADNPGGPWSEIPDTAIKKSVLPLDDARLSDPVLNWLVPVDLMTELYDPAMGAKTRLSLKQLNQLVKHFGQGFLLDDVRCWLEQKGLKIERLGWPAIVRLVTQRKNIPREGITLNNFFKDYCDLSKKPDIGSKREMLLRADRDDLIELPRIGKREDYKSGQTHLFWLDELLEQWESYRVVKTTLPTLKKATLSVEKHQ